MNGVGKLLNPNRIGEQQNLKEGFALHYPDRSQVTDSKRRDAGVVDRARLESDLLARADAQQTPPTQFRSTASRYNIVHRRVSLADAIHQIHEVSDTDQ
jgi:hypothetical protein